MSPAAATRRARPARSARAVDAASLPGAKRAAMSAEVALQLTLPVARAPSGAGWIHELKHDGYRLLARLDRKRVALITRGGKDWTERFPSVRDDVAKLRAERAILDGELVALEPDGRPSFQRLQNFMDGGRAALVFWAFDLLHLDGIDLRECSQLDRKRALAGLLGKGVGVVRYGDHVDGDGAAFLDAACARGLEGIISKRADARYRGGRGGAWLKIKCGRRQEFVVGGWTEPQGGRTRFGALLVGVYDGKAFRFAGRVGTGFDGRTLDAVAKRLAPLETEKPPFVDPPRGVEARGVHWVKPTLVVELAFGEWTGDGRLRHPSFLGVREDKRARDVVREEPVHAPRAGRAAEPPAPRVAKTGTPPRGARTAKVAPARSRATKTAPGRATKPTPARASRSRDAGEPEVAGVRISHPERVVDAESGLTKLDLARAYERLAPRLLPHVVGRPLMVLRCPGGVGGPCFHQKHRAAGLPPDAAVARVRGEAPHLSIANLEGLIALVQHNVVELHAWGAPGDDVEHPDRLVFDLDPGEGVAWSRMIAAAQELRDRLRAAGLASFPKYTGGKGVHVVAPLKPSLTWPQVRELAHATAAALEREAPKEFTANARKAQRTGRIYVDWLRNGRGATAVATWSVRARPGLPVASPLTWAALARSRGPAPLTAVQVLRGRGAIAEPWAGFAAAAKTPDRRIVAALGG